MFKARVVVTEDTDLDVEIKTVADRAQRSNLKNTEYATMIAAVRSTATAMKQSFSDTAQQGIFLQATKTVSGRDYEVTLETGSRNRRRVKTPGLDSILSIFKK